MKKSFLALTLAFICLLVLAESGMADDMTVTVKTEKANIRLQPDMNATVISQAPMGAVLKTDGKEGNWYRVTLPPNKDGFVVSGYIHQSVVLIPGAPSEMNTTVENAPVETNQHPVKKAAPKKVPSKPRISKISPQVAPNAYRQSNATKLTIRIFGKIGYLLIQPDSVDFGYSLKGDTFDFDQYLDLNGVNYGAGAQVVFPHELGSGLRLGLDTGFQKLFSMTYDTTSSDLSNIIADYDKSSEFDIYFHGMVEYSPNDKPFFLQGGAGFRVVVWDWDTIFIGQYTGDQSEYESGVDLGFGLFGMAGFNASQTDKFSVPVGIRVDALFRYGILLKASFLIGIAF